MTIWTFGAKIESGIDQGKLKVKAKDSVILIGL